MSLENHTKRLISKVSYQPVPALPAVWRGSHYFRQWFPLGLWVQSPFNAGRQIKSIPDRWMSSLCSEGELPPLVFGCTVHLLLRCSFVLNVQLRTCFLLSRLNIFSSMTASLKSFRSPDYPSLYLIWSVFFKYGAQKWLLYLRQNNYFLWFGNLNFCCCSQISHWSF